MLRKDSYCQFGTVSYSAIIIFLADPYVGPKRAYKIGERKKSVS
jgi:hypothetical protein